MFVIIKIHKIRELAYSYSGLTEGEAWASNKKALKGAAPLRYNDIPDVVECISSSSCKIAVKFVSG